MTASQRVVHRLGVWVALAAMAMLAAHLLLERPTSAQVHDLGGLWTLHAPDGTERPTGIPSEMVGERGPIELRRRISAPTDAPLALWLRGTSGAADVFVDGEPVAAIGRDGRTPRSIVIGLPPMDAFARHDLAIRLEGDGGLGLEGVAIGPVQAIADTASRHTSRDLGVAVAMAILAIVALGVRATRDAPHPGWAALGSTAATMALARWAQTPGAEERLGIGLAHVTGLAAAAPTPWLVASLFGALAAGSWSRNATLGVGAGALAAVTIVAWRPASADAIGTASLIASGVGMALAGLIAARAGRGRDLAGACLSVGAPLFVGAVGDLTAAEGTGAWAALGSVGLLTGAWLQLVLGLANARERDAGLLAGTSDAMLTCDAAGTVTDATPGSTTVLGAVSGRLFDHVHADDRPLLRAHLARAAARRDRAEFRLAQGDRTVESHGSPFAAGQVLLVLRDVTQRRRLDQGLLHAARLETVGMLLGGIAHDFNNMLGTLLAHVGILQGTVDDPRSRDRLERMEATIDRASQLTRRLLTVARGSASSLGPTDLGQVIRSASDLVDPTLPRGIGLTVDLPPDLPPVHGDAQELEQVLVNLLVNGRDALGTSGRLRLAVRPWQIEGGHRGLAVLIEDTGPGVPEALREDIFAPFFTTKGRQGTGLGLAVARQVLRDHHGRIWVEERPGGGARFLMALRHADAMDEAPAPLPEGRRVLVVDDEAVLLDGYVLALRDAGYDPVPFTDPRAAARWLESERPDLLATDVVMDGMNGIELATLCQARWPTVPILLISGFIPDASVQALSAGAWTRLHKPVRAARLVSTAGRIRRRAERVARGDADITTVTYLFPPLDGLSAKRLGFDDA